MLMMSSGWLLQMSGHASQTLIRIRSPFKILCVDKTDHRCTLSEINVLNHSFSLVHMFFYLVYKLYRHLVFRLSDGCVWERKKKITISLLFVPSIFVLVNWGSISPYCDLLYQETKRPFPTHRSVRSAHLTSSAQIFHSQGISFDSDSK